MDIDIRHAVWYIKDGLFYIQHTLGPPQKRFSYTDNVLEMTDVAHAHYLSTAASQ